MATTKRARLIAAALNEKDFARLAQMVFCAKAHLKKVRDTRDRKGRRFVFVDVILIALMAMICGCNDAEEMEDWAEHLASTLPATGLTR